jgi:hypothetical protein
MQPKYQFSKGFTDPVGDCGNFEASIDVTEHSELWGARIAVYGSKPAEAEDLREQILGALENSGSADHLRARVAFLTKEIHEISERLATSNELLRESSKETLSTLKRRASLSNA